MNFNIAVREPTLHHLLLKDSVMLKPKKKKKIYGN